jgi:hypothetical protein
VEETDYRTDAKTEEVAALGGGNKHTHRAVEFEAGASAIGGGDDAAHIASGSSLAKGAAARRARGVSNHISGSTVGVEGDADALARSSNGKRLGNELGGTAQDQAVGRAVRRKQELPSGGRVSERLAEQSARETATGIEVIAHGENVMSRRQIGELTGRKLGAEEGEANGRGNIGGNNSEGWNEESVHSRGMRGWLLSGEGGVLSGRVGLHRAGGGSAGVMQLSWVGGGALCLLATAIELGPQLKMVDGVTSNKPSDSAVQ